MAVSQNDCSPQGYSTAAAALDQIESKVNTVFSMAVSLTNEIKGYAADLSDFDFPQLTYPISIDNVSQLEQWAYPVKPTQDYSLLQQQIGQAPQADIGEISINGDLDGYPLPALQAYCLSTLTTQLCDMLSGDLGLGNNWHDAVFGRGRDQIWRDMQAQEQAVRLDTSKLGWTQLDGAAAARIDAVRHQAMKNISGVARDIYIKRLEEALQSVRRGAELGVAYLELWVRAHGQYLQAISEKDARQLRLAEIRNANIDRQIQLYRVQLESDDQRRRAIAQAFSAEVDMYRAEAGIADSISRRDQAQIDKEIKAAELSADKQIKNNEIREQARQRDIAEAINNFNTVINGMRQVTASVWQALNLAVSLRSGTSFSNGKSCSTQFNYSENLQL